MFGCFRRIGCLVVLALAVLAAWYWYTRANDTPARPAATATGPVWQPVRAQDAERGRRSAASLGSGTGPVFANLTAAEAASYLFTSAGRQLPSSAQDVQAAVIGDRLYVRSKISLADLGGPEVLGPLATFVGGKDTLQLGGTVSVVRAGLGEFRVREVKLRSFSIPARVIPKLVAQMRKGSAEGLSPDGLPLPLPPFIGDVRIANGKVTLYRNL